MYFVEKGHTVDIMSSIIVNIPTLTLEWYTGSEIYYSLIYSKFDFLEYVSLCSGLRVSRITVSLIDLTPYLIPGRSWHIQTNIQFTLTTYFSHFNTFVYYNLKSVVHPDLMRQKWVFILLQWAATSCKISFKET